MRINSLKLRNYKKFISERTFEFSDNLTVIIGNNGSGKTSILQAIVALTGTATRELKSPSKLNWGGFKYDLLQSGRMSPSVEAVIHFDQQELQETVRLFNQLRESREQLSTPPAEDSEVILYLEHERDQVASRGTASRLFQFRGYTYAKQLQSLNPLKSYFESVGSIFWYTEKRDNHSFRKFSGGGKDSEDTLREFLKSRYNLHQRLRGNTASDDSRDYYAELAKYYQRIFTDRRLDGPSPRRNPAEAFEPDWFFLSDGQSQYEIAEMSAGERAVFPLLIDFANYHINNSIIIIDEIELHLHPPLQQAFFRALPHLGRNNQFIITTHSDYIATIADPETIIRL